MKFLQVILVVLFISSCAENNPSTNTDELFPQPLDGSSSLTGSWIRDTSTYSTSKDPVAIRDYGDTLYIKYCNSFDWEELTKIGNDYYSGDTKILGENVNGEFENYHKYLGIIYPMQKVSAEIATSFGRLKLDDDNIIAIDTEKNVCAEISPPAYQGSTRISISIQTPYDQGSVVLTIHVNGLETGVYELGRDVDTSGVSLSIFPTSSYKHYYADSGEIEIIKRTDNSIAGNFTAALKWGLRSTEEYVEISNISGEFDVTFY